jgi:hypothetical protein
MAGKPKTKNALSSATHKYVQGVASPVAFYGDFMLHLDEYLADIVNTAIEAEIKDAKEGLIETEAQYAELVNDFNITYNKSDKTFSYKVTGKSRQKATALEYGPPARSILRKQCIKGAARMEKRINKALDKFTGTYGGV